MSSKVEVISPENLSSMHTGTLMNRRAALLKCEESFESGCAEIGAQPASSKTGLIEFKDTAEWKEAYQELKNILDTRENLPNKQERKEIRQTKAKQSK